MSNNVKDINIHTTTQHSFDDIINTKDFDPNNIKTDEKQMLFSLFVIDT